MPQYACPVPGCEETFGNVDSLAGHIGGKAGHDEAHAEYGNIRRFELRDCEIRSEGRMNL